MFGSKAANAAANYERGRLLYQNHCTTCHTSVLHLGAGRKARSLLEVYREIIRWQTHLDLGWSTQDMIDVLQYLNTEFYRFEERVESEPEVVPELRANSATAPHAL